MLFLVYVTVYNRITFLSTFLLCIHLLIDTRLFHDNAAHISRYIKGGDRECDIWLDLLMNKSIFVDIICFLLVQILQLFSTEISFIEHIIISVAVGSFSF